VYEDILEHILEFIANYKTTENIFYINNSNIAENNSDNFAENNSEN
jgi:hypothetical protein